MDSSVRATPSAAYSRRLRRRCAGEVHLYLYAAELTAIYSDATAIKPRRVYNSYRQPEDTADYIPFFAACMKAAKVKYSSSIIRQALEDFAQPTNKNPKLKAGPRNLSPLALMIALALHSSQRADKAILRASNRAARRVLRYLRFGVMEKNTLQSKA